MYLDRLHILGKHNAFLKHTFPERDIFFVGGCIRDILLGITQDPIDIDITSAGHPNEIRDSMQWNPKESSRFRTEKFGTMTVIPKTLDDTGKSHCGELMYELTPLRTEGSYTNVRHPDDITRSDSILADSKRRDFSINCLYAHIYTGDIVSSTHTGITHQLKQEKDIIPYLKKHPCVYLPESKILIIQDHAVIEHVFTAGTPQTDSLQEIITTIPHLSLPENNQQIPSCDICILIDPHRGLLDLGTRTLRTVGNPDDRFTEDALRILRGVRFPNIVNQHLPDKQQQNSGFTYEKTTRSSMIHHAHLVKNLAKERIHEELVKVFSGTNPFGYISLLDELGLIEILFPALATCKHNTQPTLYHPFDTYTHTLLTLHALQGLVDAGAYLAKCAMLYHDVGKPEQYAYIAEQKEKHPDQLIIDQVFHHTQTGVDIAKKDFSQLGFSKKEIEEICRYIRRHHRPGEILNSNPKNQTKKIRTLLSEGGLERALYLIDIAIADRTGQYNPLQPSATQELYEMKDTLQQLFDNEGRFTRKDLAINGNVLMKELGVSPGPELGHLLDKAFERVLGNVPERNNTKDILIQLRSL